MKYSRDPADMSEAERLHEVGTMLAAAYVRIVESMLHLDHAPNRSLDYVAEKSTSSSREAPSHQPHAGEVHA